MLGDDRLLSLKFLSISALAVGWLAILLFLMTASQIPLLGVPVATRLLPDSRLICRVIDERYGVRDCRVPRGARIGEAGR